MHARRITFIVVLAIVVIAATAVNIRADQPKAIFSPDRILKGTTPTITITLDKSISNQEQIKNVRIGGQDVAVQRPEGKLSVLLPKLDFVGRADVEVLDKDGKLVAVGQLKYVESTEPIKGVWLLVLYVFLIVLPPSVFNLYDIKKSYEERSTVLGRLQGNATIDEIKALLKDMDQGPTGFTGLTRGIIAVTLILILAIAVFHIIMFEPAVPHIAEQLLTLLAGTLTAITGFYFGSKSATEKTTPDTKSGKEETVGAEVPKITKVDLDLINNKLTVIGEGFGKSQGKGSVKVRNKTADKEVQIKVGDWEEKQIKLDVIDSLKSVKQIDIVVTNNDKKSSESFSYEIP